MNDKSHLEIIIRAQKKAKDLAIRSNKALELEYLIVKDDKVFKVLPNGEEIFLKKAEFQSINTEKKKFELQEA